MELGFGQIVPTTVDLDDKSDFVDREVSDVAADRDLASDMKISSSQHLPKHLLRQGHLAP